MTKMEGAIQTVVLRNVKPNFSQVKSPSNITISYYSSRITNTQTRTMASDAIDNPPHRALYDLLEDSLLPTLFEYPEDDDDDGGVSLVLQPLRGNETAVQTPAPVQSPAPVQTPAVDFELAQVNQYLISPEGRAFSRYTAEEPFARPPAWGEILEKTRTFHVAAREDGGARAQLVQSSGEN